MPASRRPSGIPPSSAEVSNDSADSLPTVAARLRPYAFHGVVLTTRGSHAVGDCPFCGREGKFSVEVATGLWRCWGCGGGDTANGGGNPIMFLRLLYQKYVAAYSSPANLAKIAQDRRLLFPATVAAWGACFDSGASWLIPGYAPDGSLWQLYRRTQILDKGVWVWRLLPTPGIWRDGKVHALHLPAADFDPERPNIIVMEGPWDGMALWEVWDRSPASHNTNIIAVPGCNVWRDEWTALCRGKCITLMFDSDHPRPTVSGSDRVSRAGYDGMARVARRLSGVAASVRYLKWGEEGYDASKPSGWDVRDHLTGG